MIMNFWKGAQLPRMRQLAYGVFAEFTNRDAMLAGVSQHLAECVADYKSDIKNKFTPGPKPKVLDAEMLPTVEDWRQTEGFKRLDRFCARKNISFDVSLSEAFEHKGGFTAKSLIVTCDLSRPYAAPSA